MAVWLWGFCYDDFAGGSVDLILVHKRLVFFLFYISIFEKTAETDEFRVPSDINMSFILFDLINIIILIPAYYYYYYH